MAQWGGGYEARKNRTPLFWIQDASRRETGVPTLVGETNFKRVNTANKGDYHKLDGWEVGKPGNTSAAKVKKKE